VGYRIPRRMHAAHGACASLHGTLPKRVRGTRQACVAWVRAQGCAAASAHQPTPLWAVFGSPEPPPPKVHTRTPSRTRMQRRVASRRIASHRAARPQAMARGAARSVHRRPWPRCRLPSCGPRSSTPKARPTPAPAPSLRATRMARCTPRNERRARHGGSQRASWRTPYDVARNVADHLALRQRRVKCVAAGSRIALRAGLTRSHCVPLSELDWGSQLPATADRLALGSAPSTPASMAAATASESASAAFAAAHALYAPPSTVAESRGINPQWPTGR
jgi:hypothetical protein